jgi:hypothetical protein
LRDADYIGRIADVNAPGSGPGQAAAAQRASHMDVASTAGTQAAD